MYYIDLFGLENYI